MTGILGSLAFQPSQQQPGGTPPQPNGQVPHGIVAQALAHTFDMLRNGGPPAWAGMFPTHDAPGKPAGSASLVAAPPVQPQRQVPASRWLPAPPNQAAPPPPMPSMAQQGPTLFDQMWQRQMNQGGGGGGGGGFSISPEAIKQFAEMFA